MQLLTAARLVAVSKSGGGVRPNSVGEVLRQLAAKCASIGAGLSIQPSAGLASLQVVVQVPNAAELVARRARARRGDTTDLRNAFNSLDRTQLLKEVQTRVPELYPCNSACYSDSALGKISSVFRGLLNKPFVEIA